MSYNRLYSSVVYSSLWTEPDHVRLLFITLLALSDREGCIYGSRAGLERAANICSGPDYDRGIDPWAALMAPDLDSSDRLRNPENEGRRIEEIGGGFRLLNFEHYRNLFDAEDRRRQNRDAQRRFRQRKSAIDADSQQPSATVTKDKPSAPAPAPAPAPKNTIARSRHAVTLKRHAVTASEHECLDVYLIYPRKVAKPKALRAIKTAIKKFGVELIVERTRAFAEAVEGADQQFIPHPATWFNQERFNDDPETWTRKEPERERGRDRRPKPPWEVEMERQAKHEQQALYP